MVRKLVILAGLATAGSLGFYGLGTAADAPAPPIVLASASAPARPVVATPAERPIPAAASGSAGCTEQAWPHVDRACLSAAEGTPPRGPVRTIGLGPR